MAKSALIRRCCYCKAEKALDQFGDGAVGNRALRCRDCEAARLHALRARPPKTEKRCPDCGETKPVAEFGIRANGYLRSHCRRCESAALRVFNARQEPEVVADRNARAALKHYHGLTPEQLEGLISAQEGRCAICGCIPTDRRLFVDHDHQTNRKRGLLCQHCNFGIGRFNHDPDLLKKAVAYLETPPLAERDDLPPSYTKRYYVTSRGSKQSKRPATSSA